MSDVMTPEQRSRCMSRIRGSDTTVEVRFRRLLWRAGLRYTLRSALPGRPDLTFVAARVAVFVDGCFWHACPIHGVAPKSNADFWRAKIGRNKARDAEVNGLLKAEGWTVLRVWEHEIERDPVRCARRTAGAIQRAAAKRQAPATRSPRRRTSADRHR
jgi:DNA mismatch endonuclease, patch repair protein